MTETKCFHCNKPIQKEKIINLGKWIQNNFDVLPYHLECAIKEKTEQKEE